MQEKYEYKYYQNIIITWDKFYDQSGYRLTSTPPDGYISVNPYNGADGLIPFECDPADELTLNPTNRGSLNIYFDVVLNPPNLQPQKIEIKNINASLTATNGYLFELSCPLLRYPVQFLDSLSAFTNYEEYTTPQLQSGGGVRFNLTRLSGSNPLLTVVNQPPYLVNPSLAFTIVYHYF